MSTKGYVAFTTKNERIAKFVCYVMMEGKKTLANKIINSAFKAIEAKGMNPEETFDKAFENVMPKIEVRPKRVGGSIYQVPQEVRPTRAFALASRWILASARSRRTNSEFHNSLAQELIEASQETGSAIKKKLDVYKMAEANKAFARFANNK